MKKHKGVIILGVMSLLLTFAICIQVKTIKNVTEEVGTTISDNGGLKDEVFEWKSKYNIVKKQIEYSESKLEKVRTQAISNNDTDKASEVELKENNKFLGLTDVKGKGVIIKLDDNRSVDEKEVIDISSYLVHEGDLLQIVNELFNAGADAISINGQRIVSSTAILCDGNIIRVNGEMIGVPITIKAIGYPESLFYALTRPQGYLQLMGNDGVVVEIQKSDNITISKYNGSYNYDYVSGGEE